MERNIQSLLLLPLVVFVLSAPPCAATAGVSIFTVVSISDLHTWDGAQSYCRQHYSDLITIENQQDADMLAPYEGWIGLYWKSSDWRWSIGDGTPTFLLWDTGFPSPNEKCALKSLSSPRWQSAECSDLHPFLCEETLTLVQEQKTWEEALVYCRQLQAAGYSDKGQPSNKYPYDLASLPGKNTTLLGRGTIRTNANTNEVWVGLRFLAGEWLWMSGKTAKSSNRTQCPAQQQHCGALVPDEPGWKMMDCSEKRNFLCA